MRFSALASGSSGNCFYIENKNKAILVDAGISCKQIVERLASIGKSPKGIKGIFITHEHIDHVRGADVFAREFQIPIYATEKTIKNCFLCSNEGLINPIKNDETLEIGRVDVEAFSKSHSACDPVSYTISNGKRISVITDVGCACKNVIEHVSDSNLLCLESNHDLEMLENGPYPWHLKKWIASNEGHLSNLQAGLLVLEHASSRMKNIVLAHLSQTNNTPAIALRNFKNIISERLNFHPKIVVSERFEPTEIINV